MGVVTQPQPPARVVRRIEMSRARIREAAWELAQEHPWAEITVARICERADVAPRTFARYFADKTEVMFADADAHEAYLTAAMARHSLDPDDPAPYLTAVLDDMASHIAEYGPDALLARQRIVGSSPDLSARELVKRDRLLELATDALAERLPSGDPFRARMLAVVAVHACFTGMQHWARTGGDLSSHIRSALSSAELAH